MLQLNYMLKFKDCAWNTDYKTVGLDVQYKMILDGKTLRIFFQYDGSCLVISSVSEMMPTFSLCFAEGRRGNGFRNVDGRFSLHYRVVEIVRVLFLRAPSC